MFSTDTTESCRTKSEGVSISRESAGTVHLFQIVHLSDFTLREIGKVGDLDGLALLIPLARHDEVAVWPRKLIREQRRVVRREDRLEMRLAIQQLDERLGCLVVEKCIELVDEQQRHVAERRYAPAIEKIQGHRARRGHRLKWRLKYA